MSPPPTLAPSSSSLPTETCYWVEVAITYDNYPSETSWDIYRVVGNGIELIEYHEASHDDNSFIDTTCLQEGEYIFYINDSGLNAICCQFGEGHYNVTSNNMLIVEGGEWVGSSERTSFIIPFDPLS